MPYRLDGDVAVPDAIRATATSRLLHAADALTASVGDSAVLTARKDVQKTRAVLRLARPAIKTKQYRRINAALRSAAASLSPARDAHVLGATIDGLHDHAAGQLPERSFTALADRARQSAGGDEAWTVRATETADALRSAAADVVTWRVDEADDATLAIGITTVYRRGHEAMTAAGDDPSGDALHAWRKRVKDLAFAARLLHDRAPRQMKALARDAGELAALLGDERDLAALRTTLVDPDGLARDLVVDVGAMVDLVDARRGALREELVPLATRVYAERPKAFGRRLSVYLTS